MRDQITTALVAETADMREGLKFLKRAMNSKSLEPILDNVLFPGDGTMKATNLDQEAIWNLTDGRRAAGHEPFTVPHKALVKLLSGADKGSFATIAPPVADHERSGVLVDGMHSRLSTLPAEDFPTPNARQLRIRFEMGQVELRNLLAFVDPCISSEETRNYLNGVYFHAAKGKLVAVATDGHKLAFRETSHEWPTEDRGAIVPTDAVRAVLATLGKKPSGDLEVEIHTNGASFRASKWTLNTRTIDGTFPDYTRVIPTNPKEHVTLPLADSCKILARLSKLAKTGGSPVQLDSETLNLELRDEDGDTHAMPLPKGTRRTGEGHAQGFNSAYLKAALDTFADTGADAVKLSTEDANNPAVMKAPGVPGLWVVMPLRY